MMNIGHEASFYEKRDDGVAACALCPRRCVLAPGSSGFCLARRNSGGTLYSDNYGKISSLALDPIEKKPLNRFRPGSAILSAGSFGCNFSCLFCQNHGISREIPETYDAAPSDLVRKARAARTSGNIGIAYTYNEPIVWYEFVYDTAKLAARENLLNVLVTNGCIEPAPLSELLPYIAAMNIDLKGGDSFYKEMCGGGDRAAVLGTIKAASGAGCHVEVTTLLVRGQNDTLEEVSDAAKQIASISEDIPLHLTRFYPRYKMAGTPPTDAAFIYEAVALARSHLKYVYPGNV